VSDEDEDKPRRGKKSKAPAYDLGPMEAARTDGEDAAQAAPGAGPVPVRASDGSVGTVDREQLAQALDSGAQVVDGKTLADAKLEADYGGTSGAAIAGAAGAARGLTMGGSDLLARKLGGSNAANALAAYKEANPTASTVGEVAGAAAPLLASDGLLGVAGFGVRGAAATGEAAAAGARALVGEGGGLLARAARGAATYGAQGAAEGSLYGAGEAVSEASLGDRDVTGEELFASMGKGALFGGALGAGQGVLHGGAGWAGHKVGEGLDRAGTAISDVADRAGTKVSDVVGSAAASAREGLTSAGEAVGGAVTRGRDAVLDGLGRVKVSANEALEDARSHARELYASARDAADAGSEKASTELERLAQEAEKHADALYKRAGEVVDEGVNGAPVTGIDGGGMRVASDKAASLADEAAYRAMAAGKWNGIKGVREAERFGGISGLGKFAREELPALAGVENYAGMDIDKVADATAKGMKREGTRLRDILEEASANASKKRALPSSLELVQSIEEHAAQLEKSKLGAAPAVRKLREIAADAANQLKLVDESGALTKGAKMRRVSLMDLRDLRGQIDDLTYTFGQGHELAGYKKEFQALRGKIESQLEGLVEEHGSAALRGDYLNAKRKYSALKTISRIAEEGKLSNSNNRFFSLGDRIAGSAGMMIGGAIGGVPGMIVGHSTGSMMGKFARERGGYLLGHYLTKEGQQQALHAGAEAAQHAADGLRKVGQLEQVQNAKTWVQREIVDSVKRALHESIDAAGTAAGTAKKRVTDAVDDAKATARRGVEAVDSKARSLLDAASGTVKRAGDDVRGRYQSAAHEARQLRARTGEAIGSAAKTTSEAAAEGVKRVEQVERQIAAIQGAAQNPDVLHAHVQRAVGGLTDLPETSGAVAGQAAKAVQYLAANVPTRLPSSPMSLGPRNAARSPYDAHALAQWEARVAAVQNPMVVLHALGAGKATRAGVDAVKNVYPQLYTKMTTQILNELAGMKAKGKSPSYGKRLQLGIILGTATDWSLEPGSVKALQSAAAGAPEDSAPPPQAMASNGPARPMTPIASQDGMTTTERLGNA
jgi:hypothetical protein